MATTVGSLAPKGAVKQGGLLGKVDFGNGTWEFFICVFSGTPWLYGRYNATGGAVGQLLPFTDDSVKAISNADFGVLYNICDVASQPAIQYTTQNVSYVADNSKDVYYTDGAGNFKATPYTDATTAETVSNILKQATGGGTTTNGSPTNSPDTTPWYKKTITYVIGGLIAAGLGAWLYFKK